MCWILFAERLNKGFSAGEKIQKKFMDNKEANIIDYFMSLWLMLFSQSGDGVEIFSPLGILILVIGIAFTVGLPLAMIK